MPGSWQEKWHIVLGDSQSTIVLRYVLRSILIVIILIADKSRSGRRLCVKICVSHKSLSMYFDDKALLLYLLVLLSPRSLCDERAYW
jgi:hypothetical protein